MACSVGISRVWLDDVSARADVCASYDRPMANEHVVEIGKLLGDATRVALLDALFDGRAYTVTELSRHVGVAPSTASEHLGRLLDAGLVAVEAQGKHRYHRLAGGDVAELLERLFEFGGGPEVSPASRVPAAMVYARSCYDHLAGVLAVALTEHLFDNDLVAEGDGGLVVTGHGRDVLAPLGFRPPERRPTRPVVRSCLDWSERRHHLAGSMPAQMLGFFLDEGWFQRRGSSRALTLTDAGRAGLVDHLGFTAP